MKLLSSFQILVCAIIFAASACSSDEVIKILSTDGDTHEVDFELDLSQYEAQEYEFYDDRKIDGDTQELDQVDMDIIEKADPDLVDNSNDGDQDDKDCLSCSGVGAYQCVGRATQGCTQWNCMDGCMVLSIYTQSDEFGYCSGNESMLCNSCKKENYKSWGYKCTPPDIGYPWDFTATSSIFQKDNDNIYLLYKDKLQLYSIRNSTTRKRADIKPVKEFQMPENTWAFVVDTNRLIALSNTHLHFFFLYDNQELKLINSLKLGTTLPKCCEQTSYGPRGFSVRKGVLYLPVFTGFGYPHDQKFPSWLYGIDVSYPNIPNLIQQTKYNATHKMFEEKYAVMRSKIIFTDYIAVQHEHIYDMNDDWNYDQWQVVGFDNNKKPVNGKSFAQKSPCCYGYQSDIRISDDKVMMVWYDAPYMTRALVEFIDFSDKHNPELISLVDFRYNNDFQHTVFNCIETQFLYHSITGAVMKENTEAKLCYTEFATKDSLTPQKCIAIDSSATSTKAISYILDGDDYYVVWDDRTVNKYDLKVLLKRKTDIIKTNNK